ncbi:hypothetical protein CFIO01_03970 [Colletotrichum fioriniae PJ7]|uniref:Protein kinase domain-containing protein n=1 Tax=Colletotrichum fioriniae PJ7 TaxID=1445577 RepID=A0A010RBL7_9PEZI|nr:hypothetical protein CFIO01_03970 [Colletotrichum fioriniae PJ7]
MPSPSPAQRSQLGPLKPTITSLRDLTLIEAWDNDANAPKYVTFYHITDEAELWFGQSSKNKREISLKEYQQALELVPDEEIYPEIPTGVKLTIAPDNIDDAVFVKRPGLSCYESMKGTPYVWKSVLDETLIMEKVSKNPHPYIIKYYGCRTARGRITSLVLKSYECTLTQFSRQPGFKDLDKEKFLDGLESAVAYVHSLGLAHNDINPDNIMMGEDGMPVLIEFGSCAPYGQNLQSLGTDGWYEEVFFTSEKSHDDFAMKKMRVWIQDPPV